MMQPEACLPERVNTDFITVTIIQSALKAIAEKMFIAMKMTAMSPLIYELLDMSTVTTDAEGNLTTSGAGMPGFC